MPTSLSYTARARWVRPLQAGVLRVSMEAELAGLDMTIRPVSSGGEGVRGRDGARAGVWILRTVLREGVNTPCLRPVVTQANGVKRGPHRPRCALGAGALHVPRAACVVLPWSGVEELRVPPRLPAGIGYGVGGDSVDTSQHIHEKSLAP